MDFKLRNNIFMMFFNFRVIVRMLVSLVTIILKNIRVDDIKRYWFKMIWLLSNRSYLVIVMNSRFGGRDLISK